MTHNAMPYLDESGRRQALALTKRAELARAIDTMHAWAADEVGYMGRALVQCTLPHSDPKTNEFSRSNGQLKLIIMAPSELGGVPYGSMPRVLLYWLTAEAVRTASRHLELGDTLAEFLRKLGLPRTGGPRGAITQLRKQARRLFGSMITSIRDGRGGGSAGFDATTVAEGGRGDLWWHPQNPDQAGLWASKVTLAPLFYKAITQNPVPLDLRALRLLRKSPMALDAYCWLTHRMSYLRHPAVVPWDLLELQFGGGYTRERAFKEKFIKAMQKVLVAYPQARVSAKDTGLELLPSPTHVPRLLERL